MITSTVLEFINGLEFSSLLYYYPREEKARLILYNNRTFFAQEVTPEKLINMEKCFFFLKRWEKMLVDTVKCELNFMVKKNKKN